MKTLAIKNKELSKELKKIAISQNKTMIVLLEEIIEDFVKKNKVDWSIEV